METFKENFNIHCVSNIFLITAIGIHVIFIYSLIFGFLNPLFYDSTYRLGQGADFFSFYQAGYNVLFGFSPYERIKGYYIVPYSYDYRYLPFFAYTFGILFNLFPPLIAYLIWVIFILFLIWYSCWITYVICKKLEKPKWVLNIAIGMWLCFSPIYLELYMGQTTLFVGLLTFYSCYSELRKKNMFGTILWSLASIIKFIPFTIAPAILSSGRTKKVILNILITIAVIISFSLTLFFVFLNYNLQASTKFNDDLGNFDLKNLIYYLSILITLEDSWFLNNRRYINLTLLIVFFGLSITATIYSKDYLVSMSLFVCSYFLAISGVWEHHFTFLLPFIIMLWIKHDSRLKWLIIFILLAIPTPFYLIDSFGTWNLLSLLVYKCSKTVPLVILFIFLIIRAFKTPRQKDFLNSIRDIKNKIINGLKEQHSENLPNAFIDQ